MPNPSVNEHVIPALCGGRRCYLAPVAIQPGQTAPINLPYGGLRATDYLQRLMHTGEEPVGTLNQTTEAITLYHIMWTDTGNYGGWSTAKFVTILPTSKGS